MDLSDLVGPTTARNVDAMAGNLVRVARMKADVSQREMARRAGVPASTVQRIEAGEQQPTVPMLCRLLYGVGLELRPRIETFDDHDLVLDRRAARLPEEHARMEEIRDGLLAGFRR